MQALKLVVLKIVSRAVKHRRPAPSPLLLLLARCGQPTASHLRADYLFTDGPEAPGKFALVRVSRRAMATTFEVAGSHGTLIVTNESI